MRLALIFPRMKYKTGDPPTGLALIAAIIRRAGHDVEVVDSTFHPIMQYVNNRLESFNPDFVCVYVDSLSFNLAINICDDAKRKKKTVIIGGPHATLKPESLKKHADYIVVGEADEVILEIIEGKHKKGVIKPKKPDLSKLPIPAYDLLEMDKYMRLWHPLDSVNPNLRGTSIISSRGCPFQCSFCQPVLEKMFGKGVRTRTVNSIIEEIKYLKKEYDIDGVFFHDDTFTVRKKWVDNFCNKLLKEKIKILWGMNTRIDQLDEKLMKLMYKAGLRVMHIGIESGSQRMLDEIYNKGIDLSKVPQTITKAKKIGIQCLCFFMMGAPGETREEIEQTIKFAASLDATEATATIATPLPGTYLYEKTKKKYKVTKDFSNFDYYKNRAFEDPTLSLKKLKWLQKKLLIKFYTRPKRWGYIARHLFSLKGWRTMYLKIMRFM
ncbi:MAG: B12-binding domain-containing radical SAM protein [Nanoarchaeota archaeon]|nr:B12-binding domain-containing radical SAM protein [Nanoarchaeota archaeon]